MPRKEPAEKRKYARLELMSRVNFSVVEIGAEPGPAKRFRAVGKNIGVEGLLLTADKELEKGMLLDLEIFLPNKTDPVYIEGEVRWCRPSAVQKTKKTAYDAGIKFLTINKSHVLMLIKYVCGSLAADDAKKLR